MPFNPLISIIVPTYNRAELIIETLSSVINQSYQNWECIVVDDGSDDDTTIVVQEIIAKEPRIKFFKREILPKGANKCRNIGIEKSAGTYIIFLDSDDLLANFCLKKRVSLYETYSDLDFLVFNTLIFKSKAGDSDTLQNIKTEEDVVDKLLRRDPPWLIMSPIWKKTSLLKLNGFDETLPCYQEYDLHIRALIEPMNYFFFNELPPDNFQRISSEGRISNQSSKHEIHLIARAKLYVKIALLLIQKNIYNESRKKIIASLFFELERENMWHKMQTGTVYFNFFKLWRNVKELKCFTSIQYFLSLLYISLMANKLSYKFPKFQKRILKIFAVLFLPKALYGLKERTFYKYRWDKHSGKIQLK